MLRRDAVAGLTGARGEGALLSRARSSGAGADPRGASRRGRALGGCAAGRARARLGRNVAAPGGASAHRARRVATRGDECLLPRCRRRGVPAPRGRAHHHRASALRAAVAPAGARGVVTGAGVAAGLAILAAGGLLSLSSRAFALSLWAQAAGALVVAAVGFWALGSGTSAGASFTSSFEPRFGVD